MKPFLKQLSIFISPILLFLIILEVVIRFVPSNYSLKKRYLEENSAQIETLILGSSHTFYGLNPQYIKNSFNLANPSQSFKFDYNILKENQEGMSQLKTIIVPMSYHSLWSNFETSSPQLIPNYIIHFDYKSNVLKHHFFLLSKKVLLNITHALKIRSSKGAISCSDLGWGTRYDSSKSKNLEQSGIERAKRHSVKILGTEKSDNLIRENVDYLTKIIQWAQNNNIQVLLLTTPYSEPYIKRINLEQYNLMDQTGKRLEKDYENCTYLNLMKNNEFHSEDFYDSDHLNNIGAKKLSQKVDNVINTMFADK